MSHHAPTLHDEICEALDALGWTPLRLHSRNGVVFVWTPTGRVGIGNSAVTAALALLQRSAAGEA